jgi:hypothetical protein
MNPARFALLVLLPGVIVSPIEGVAQEPCCPVIELRQYTLHPGRREVLIELFDREFLESQEATGMRVIAQYRDIDRPDMFVWLRGFADMPSRAGALGAFYGGSVWKAHKAAANATMIDSDNVLLLRPARAGAGFWLGDRAPLGSTAIPTGLIVGTVYSLRETAAKGFTEFFERSLVPRLTATGARPIVVLETEPAVNTFPALPVRAGEKIVVWFARYADLAEYDRHVATLTADRVWANEIRPALDDRLAAPAQVLRLTPTARSRVGRAADAPAGREARLSAGRGPPAHAGAR